MNQQKIKGGDRNPYFIYCMLTLAVTVVAVVLRTLNLFLFFDVEIGYYTQGSVFPTVYVILLWVAAVVFGVFAFVRVGKVAPRMPLYTKPLSVCAILCVLSCVWATLGMSFVNHSPSSAPSFALSVLLPITALATELYFILFALKKNLHAVSVGTGFFTLLWLVIVLISSYFNVYVAMNAPLKLALQLATVGGMLLMLSEMRLLCGAPRKAFSLFSLSLSTLFLLSVSIPNIVATLAGVLPARDAASADYFFLALGIFSLLRLLSPLFSRVPETEADAPVTEESEPDESETQNEN